MVPHAAHSGAVAALWRYPVKSMGGEPLGATRLGPDGVAGDRAHALLEHHKGDWKLLTVRRAPEMLRWHAAYPAHPDDQADPADPPLATLTDPDGLTWRWSHPALAEKLETSLGREIRLRRAPGEMHDLPGTVLVTFEATRRAVEDELGRELDIRRFRPNLHLEAEAPAFAEEGWEGGAVRLEGGVVLRLLHPCERCVIPTRDPDDPSDRWPKLLKWIEKQRGGRFGINAAVETPGLVSVGTALTIEPPG